MAYQKKDHYYFKAKEENYAARSAFKLDEIQKKFRIFQPGHHVIDLGSAPGSWSQFLSKTLGPKGRVCAIDLLPMTISLPNVVCHQGDIREVNWEQLTTQFQLKFPFDSLVSDMAPKTTGIRFADQERSQELCQFALNLSLALIKPGGHFVCKLFHSASFEDLRKAILSHYERFEAIRPNSTRTESKEIFLIGLKRIQK